jgi:hypothetical protein
MSFLKYKIKTEPVEQEECETLYEKLFVLEENIMSCWNIIDDIKEVANLARKSKLGEGDMLSILDGIVLLYSSRFEKAQETHAECCGLVGLDRELPKE